MVTAGITVHYLFATFGTIPEARPESLMEMMSFGVNTHTFWLNVLFGIVAVVLLVNWWRAKKKMVREEEQEEEQEAHT